MDGIETVCLTTEVGIKALGRVAKKAREDCGWSLQDVTEELRIKTGFKLTPSAVSDLENGKREPQYNTLAKLVTVGYIKSPEGKPYQVSELFKIACEQIDPETGLERELAGCAGCR